MPDRVMPEPLPRVMRYAQPMQRGDDIMRLQRMLLRADPEAAGREIKVVDGFFGPATRRAVLAFQERAGLAEVDGVVGPKSWAMLQLWQGNRKPLADSAEGRAAIAASARNNGAAAVLEASLADLTKPHAVFSGGVTWRLTPAGLDVAGKLEGQAGEPVAARRAFDWFGDPLRRAAAETGVPLELLVATACTEVLGDTRRFATREAAAKARREEPGYESDEATPHRVSVGLMQTLISTARQVLPLPEDDPDMAKITAATLEDPAKAILAGACYIESQAARTKLDPPVVACAYNAGAVHEQTGPQNRWRMRQYPIGTGNHADRFVIFFNHAMRLIAAEPGLAEGAPSFWAMLNR